MPRASKVKVVADRRRRLTRAGLQALRPGDRVYHCGGNGCPADTPDTELQVILLTVIADRVHSVPGVTVMFDTGWVIDVSDMEYPEDDPDGYDESGMGRYPDIWGPDFFMRAPGGRNR